jgi:hypothetical protein
MDRALGEARDMRQDPFIRLENLSNKTIRR